MGLTERSFLERMELMGITESRAATNADRVRAMSDEELAEFFEKVVGCGPSFDKKYCNNVNGCPEGSNCWLDWLKQEVQDG